MNTCETCRFYAFDPKNPLCRKESPKLVVTMSDRYSNSENGTSQTYYTVDGRFPPCDGLGCGEHEPKEKIND